MRTRFTCISYALFNCLTRHDKFRFGFFRVKNCFYWHAWSYNPVENYSREWIQFPSWFFPSSVSIFDLLRSLRPYVGYENIFYGDRLTYVGKYIKVKVNTPLCFLLLTVLIPFELIAHLIWR